MSADQDWCVAVFRCKPEQVKEALVGVYKFTEGIEGVKSLHFLVRDRVEGEVVFSFRVEVEPKLRGVVKSKVAYKFGQVLADGSYAVDPCSGSPFEKYVAWSPEKRIAEFGLDKFREFTNIVHRMSGLVVQFLEKDYFGSGERVELSHLFVWMLGCTEYGLLSTSGMEVGYYDRLSNKYSSYLREEFSKKD